MIDWISKSEYAQATGKSEYQVQTLMNEGLLEAKLSDGGGKWLVKVDRNEDVQKLTKEVYALSAKVDMLLRHLGVQTDARRRL